MLTSEINFDACAAALSAFGAEIARWDAHCVGGDVLDATCNTPAEAAMLSRLDQTHGAWARGLATCPGLVSPDFAATHRIALLNAMERLRDRLSSGSLEAGSNGSVSSLSGFWLAGHPPFTSRSDDAPPTHAEVCARTLTLER